MSELTFVFIITNIFAFIIGVGIGLALSGFKKNRKERTIMLEKIFFITGILAFCLYLFKTIADLVLAFIIGLKKGKNNE